MPKVMLNLFDEDIQDIITESLKEEYERLLEMFYKHDLDSVDKEDIIFDIISYEQVLKLHMYTPDAIKYIEETGFVYCRDYELEHNYLKDRFSIELERLLLKVPY